MKKLILFLLPLMSVAAMAQPCSDLFISEYIEGTQNNKGIEIYNPTGSSVNLSDYTIIMNWNNTGDVNTYTPSGTLAAGDVFVVVTDEAAPAMIAASDDTLGFPSIVHFTGDDMVALLNASNDTIDKIGIFNGDATTVSGTPNGLTNHTVVRKATVQEGTNDWTVGQNQWNVEDEDDFSFLGSHSMNPCGTITDTTAGFLPTAATVQEEDGTVDMTVSLNAAGNFTVDVVLKSGDASQIDNYTTQTVTFSGTTSEDVTVTLTDDMVQEPAESFVFALRNTTGNLMVGADSLFTLTISASDVPTPQYTIAQVRGANTDGVPDSSGVVCQINATVLSGNLNPDGLSFFINDGTAGMGVYAPSSASDFGYTPMEGDSLVLIGEVSDFNGFARLEFLDTVYLVGTGTVPSPAVTTGSLDESTEGELLRINGLSVVSTISSTGAGATYEVTDGTDNYELRIDSDAGYSGSLPASFDAIGVGTQFDFDFPAVGGYQLEIRYDSDIIPNVGIHELSQLGISLYPNPVSGQFTMNLQQEIDINDVTITDITGKAVTGRVNLNSNGTTITGNVNQLNSGVYFITIHNEQLHGATRFVVNR